MIPEGCTPLESMTITKGLDEEGSVVMWPMSHDPRPHSPLDEQAEGLHWWCDACRMDARRCLVAHLLVAVEA